MGKKSCPKSMHIYKHASGLLPTLFLLQCLHAQKQGHIPSPFFANLVGSQYVWNNLSFISNGKAQIMDVLICMVLLNGPN